MIGTTLVIHNRTHISEDTSVGITLNPLVENTETNQAITFAFKNATLMKNEHNLFRRKYIDRIQRIHIQHTSSYHNHLYKIYFKNIRSAHF